MRRLMLNMLTAVALAAMTGCNHKDLCFDHTHTLNVKVVFDWRNASDANPSSMELHLYGVPDNEASRYSFSGRDGGLIHIQGGKYNGLCFNNDNTDWALYRNISDIETFEIYTMDATMLQAYGLLSRAVPRAEGTEGERMASTPQMVWCDRQDEIDIPIDATDKTITLYPEEAVCHYTVDIDSIQNMDYLSGSTLDATISGMAEGYRQGQKSATDTKVTMPFELVADSDKNDLHAEFLTFGESPVTKNPHILTVYMILSDGSKWYYTFDVSQQIYNAPDPRHVHIVIHGLKLPKPMLAGGGLQPDVNDWNTDYVDITM